MSEQALAELQAIIDRLGPGMGLVLDDAATERYFGPGLDEQTIRRARLFGEPSGCIVSRDGLHGVKFGRAYYKR